MISTYLIALLIKVLLLALPITVAVLALRRMLQSETANAWLYGATALCAGITTIGVAPWATGLASAPSLFLILSASSPVVWLLVILICDRDRMNRYDNKPLQGEPPAPLMLTDPVLPQVPVFRHSKPGESIQSIAEPRTGQVGATAAPKGEAGAGDVARSVLAVARAMRGSPQDSREGTPYGRREGRMPDSLDLPFLARTGG